MVDVDETAMTVAPAFPPETSCAPEVRYARATLTYENRDEQFVRVSFERWDALRVCRGEYAPYPFGPEARAPGALASSCFVVGHSPWLAERYAYEKKHYERAYNFGDNVDEMLTDFEHYVLCFHDEFVEVIAGGIWFELSDKPFTEGDWLPDHPKLGLRPADVVETSEYEGISYEVRRSHLPATTLKARALLCAQPILEFVARLGPSNPGTADLSVSLRERQGRTTCICRKGPLGTELARFDRLPTIEEVRPRFLAWLDQIAAERRRRGLQ